MKGDPFELRGVTPETSCLARGTILRLESGPLVGNRCWVELTRSASRAGDLLHAFCLPWVNVKDCFAFDADRGPPRYRAFNARCEAWQAAHLPAAG